MDRQIAFILAGACVALGVGGYLMTESMGAYDLDKSSREQAARVERMEKGGEKPSLFAALLSKASSKMELARNQYMGQYLPDTPKGWKIQKTHHDEIVDFTTDYQLEMGINDTSSVRRLMAWGGSTLERTTDVKYTKGNKVIFMRLVFDKKKRKKPIGTSSAWMFGGSGQKVEPVKIGDVYFERRSYEGHPLVNLAAPVSANAAIGIFGNGSISDVEQLMSGMDVAGFASEGPKTKSGGGLVVASKSRELQTLDPNDDDEELSIRRGPKPSPKGNLMANLGSDDEEPSAEDSENTAVKKERKSRNLLGSLLQKAGVGGSEEEKPLKAERRKDDRGSSFSRVGNFTSKCETGGGAKICRVGE